MVAKQRCFWSACWAEATWGSIEGGVAVMAVGCVHQSRAWLVVRCCSSVQGSSLILKSQQTRYALNVLLDRMQDRRPLGYWVVESWQVSRHRLYVQDGRALLARWRLAWKQLTMIGEIVLVLGRRYVGIQAIWVCIKGTHLVQI